jgi:general secretion pathway protein G
LSFSATKSTIDPGGLPQAAYVAIRDSADSIGRRKEFHLSIGRRNNIEGEQGFTLIELLIVIVILGILAAVVVFAVGGITQRSTTNACKSDWKTVNTAQEAYKADNGSYAADVQSLKSPGLYIKTIPSQASYRLETDTSGDIKVYAPGDAATPAGTLQASCP